MSDEVRIAYDTVAGDYAERFADELDAKPLDRALLGAFVELTGPGTIGDVGCGPGHVTRFLADVGAEVVGVDLSSAMIEVARRRHPGLRFAVASMLDMPAVADGAWSGAVALYSIIHLHEDERSRAFAELARVVRPGGRLLVSFHVDSPDFASGDVNHLTEFLGRSVRLAGRFLDPQRVADELAAAGFAVTAQVLRDPDRAVEYPSRRAYLLAVNATGR